MNPVIEARNLRFSYDSGFQALCGVDFRLDPGQSMALLGPNGSGKTTFLLHLNGVLQGEGELHVCGLPVEPRHYVAIRRKVGFLFQDPEDQLFLPSILEDVCFGPLQSGMSQSEAEARARRVLEQVGILTGWDRPPYHLSGGEKQRVALAGILAVDPEILILDEPTTHLDPPARRLLLELLQSLPQAKLVVTHDTGFAKALCPHAAFFEGGRVQAQGSTEEIVARFHWEI